MTKLLPMTQPELDAFLELAIPEYAADHIRAGYWDEAEALEKSRKEFETLLPQGVQSENHYLYSIYDGDVAVGVIWMRVNMDPPTKSGFIFDLRIDEKFRGRGYGKQAMFLIEEKARELGLKSLALHVFAVDAVAPNLYESVGYEVSSLYMTKKL